MRRYEKYRDSGVAWLGEIPEHWELRFLEQVCKEKCEKNLGNKENNVLSLSYGRIIRKQNIYGGLVAKDFADYQIVKNGDIILRFTDLQNDHKSLRTGLVTETGIITAAYVCIKPTINSAYLHYLLHAYDVRKVFYGMGAGVRQSINYKDVRHMLVPVPPLSEQNQIVKFLNYKVSRIDKLISIRQRQIIELEDLKKAIISKAVTKGLNPDVPMKYSGVEWIGDIPAAWEVVCAKRYVLITNGTNPTLEGDIPVYGSGKEPFKTCGEYKDGPTVLLGRKGTINNPTYVEGKYWNVDTAFDVKTRKNNFSIKYYYYLSTRFDYDFYMTQTAIPGMTQTDYNNMSIPVPPLHEQTQIAAYLDKKCAQIDNAVSNTQKQIVELTDLKARLISDVVTGKIDIR